ncbi:MAG: alpha/beta fold hydrolase [Pseudomonadota bacterium]|nr:alpha/beta fold hydrolase [Pseudomonadota bacterium]
MHYLNESAQAEEGGPTPSTFLCLHGHQGWSYQYRKVIPSLLQAGHRVIAPDLIGFGKSDKPKKESFHTFARHRQILLELVERLDLHHVVLLVQARGDLLGLSLPLAAPQRYRSLWVMSTALASQEMTLSGVHPVWGDIQGQKSEFDSIPVALYESSQTGPEDAAALQAPFPDPGHRAAPRAFARMGLESEVAEDSALACELRHFWRECWTGQILIRPG